MSTKAGIKSRFFELFPQVFTLIHRGKRTDQEIDWLNSQLQRFKGRTTPVNLTSSMTHVRAEEIMGNHFVSMEDAALAQRQSLRKNAIIHYSERVLRAAAEDNRNGVADWWLVYIFGTSLNALRLRFSLGRAHFTSNDLWRNPSNAWADVMPVDGYYLLDMKGRFRSLSWDNQEREIKRLGAEYSRAHEAVVTEAAFTLLNLRDIRIAMDWYHWGCSLDSTDWRVRVGFSRDENWGWDVKISHPSSFHISNRVIVMRKPHEQLSARLIERLVEKGIARDEAMLVAKDFAEAEAETEAEFANLDEELRKAFKEQARR